MDLVILTGASRGLGRAMAARLLDPSRRLLTISRSPDATLAQLAVDRGALLDQWALDVAHDVGVAARIEAWLHQHSRDGYAHATLIANAGVLGPVGPIEDADADDIAQVVRVNLEAPFVLTAAFLRATAAWKAERRVLLVSSGAGRRPIAGWAGYCVSKAGLDHLARVVAIDEQRQPNPARIVSLAPGVIDTDMQVQVRDADPAGFPDLETFRSLKASGQLATPDAAAARVLAYLDRADFGSTPVADVRDA